MELGGWFGLMTFCNVTSYPGELAGTGGQPGCGGARRRCCGVVGKQVKPGQRTERGILRLVNAALPEEEGVIGEHRRA